MRTKRKLSITIDEDVFEAVEEASKAEHMAKSRLAEDAFKLWLKTKTQELMAKGYEEMAEEDEEFSELAIHGQREILG
mgnify:CR=1 FL=1